MSSSLLLKYGDCFICSNRLFALLFICQLITKLSTIQTIAVCSNHLRLMPKEKKGSNHLRLMPKEKKGFLPLPKKVFCSSSPLGVMFLSLDLICSYAVMSGCGLNIMLVIFWNFLSTLDFSFRIQLAAILTWTRKARLFFIFSSIHPRTNEVSFVSSCGGSTRTE